MRGWPCQAVLWTGAASCPFGSTSLLLTGRQWGDIAHCPSALLLWVTQSAPSAAQLGGSKWRSHWLQGQTNIGENPALP